MTTRTLTRADETPEAGTVPALQTEGISKSYGSTKVLETLSIQVGQGEFVSLLGPSGCGKTTTLNIVSGFVTPDSGTVSINGDVATHLPAHKRDSSVVFQNYALFPHLTVEKNVSYGLRAKKIPKPEIQERVEWALRLVDIRDLKGRFPGQLSGGQQQRVAVARSLVMRPGILLMDEPLSNLDAKLRAELRLELKALQRNIEQAVLFVTHDQLEALSLSDRVIVMNRGNVEQVGTPRDVYEQPRTVFVARFMGVENVFEFDSQEAGFVTSGGVALPSQSLPTGCQAVGIRPSMVHISNSPPQTGTTTWTTEGTVRSVTYLGDSVRYEVQVKDEDLVSVSNTTNTDIAQGHQVTVSIDVNNMIPLALNK